MFASHVKGKVNTFGGKLAWECLWVEDGSTFYWTAAKMKGTVMECCRSSSRKQKKYKRNICTKTFFFFCKVLTKEFPVTRGKYEKKQNWYSVKGWSRVFGWNLNEATFEAISARFKFRGIYIANWFGFGNRSFFIHLNTAPHYPLYLF